MKSHSGGINFFDELPEEMRLLVLTYFSARELAAIMLICKHSNLLANDNSLWKALLEKYIGSTCILEFGEGKETFKRAIEFSKMEHDKLLELAKRDLEAAKFILRIPVLVNKLINAKDFEEIGVAHEEAAKLILTNRDLVQNIIGKPEEGKPFYISSQSLFSLAKIIITHKSVAQEFLMQEHFMQAAFISWIGADVTFSFDAGIKDFIQEENDNTEPASLILEHLTGYFSKFLKIGLLSTTLMNSMGKPFDYAAWSGLISMTVSMYDEDPERYLMLIHRKSDTSSVEARTTTSELGRQHSLWSRKSSSPKEEDAPVRIKTLPSLATTNKIVI